MCGAMASLFFYPRIHAAFDAVDIENKSSINANRRSQYNLIPNC
jgi:hypothetical protein